MLVENSDCVGLFSVSVFFRFFWGGVLLFLHAIMSEIIEIDGLNDDNIYSASETDRLARTTRRLPPTPASRRYSSELPRKNISDDEFMNTPSADNSNTTGSFTLFPDLNGSSRRLPLSDEKSSSGRVSQNRARSLGANPISIFCLFDAIF